MGRFDRDSGIAMMLALMTASQRMQVRAAVVLVVFAGTLVAAAPAAGWPGPPRTAAPHVKGASGPPAAWLETRARSVWLAFSGYCWKTTCADFPPPQSRTNLPVVRVRRGALVRVHFAFSRPRCTRPRLRLRRSGTQRCARRARRVGGQRARVSSPSTSALPPVPRPIWSAFASHDLPAARRSPNGSSALVAAVRQS
jgi:VanZ family protein